MKKEGKSIRTLMISILVLVMTMALMAGCTEQPAETTAPQETEPAPVVQNYDVWYCATPVQKMELDSTDNTVHITLYNKGLKVTGRCASVEAANEVCWSRIMLLEKDEKGFITGALPLESAGAELVAAEAYVAILDGKNITLTSKSNGAGEKVGTFEMAEKCVLTDVTGGTAVGTTVKLRTNDVVYAVANAEGKVTHIFVSARGAEQKLAHCDHCDEDVTWTAWYPDKNALPATKGHFYLTGDIVAKATSTGANEIILDLNGHTVNGTANAKLYTLNNKAAVLYIMDSSEEQTGKMVGAKCSALNSAGGLIAVSTSGAKAYLLSGTLDASQIGSIQTGAAVYAAKGTSFTMEGGKIIGGTVSGTINESTGADQGGRGGAINVGAGATVTINAGEVVGGKAVLATTDSVRAQGGAVYVYAGAKLIVNGGKISGGTAELGGNCVYAEAEGCVENNGGEIENVEVKAAS